MTGYHNPCCGAPGQRKLAHLESLRLLAALQVLALHLLSAYAPGLVRSTPGTGTLAGYIHVSPLFVLYDGYSAVYLFFLLSGYVLTLGFKRQSGWIPNLVAARALRLGIPALAACMFSALLLFIFGHGQEPVGRLVNSEWMSVLWHPQLTFGYVLKDGLINALFIGYRGAGGFNWLQPFQNDLTESFVSPFWTLSWEFWGSILTLLLVRLRRLGTLYWVIALTVSSIYFVRSDLICFILGHLAATYALAEKQPKLPAAIAWMAILGGAALCSAAEVWTPSFVTTLCIADTAFLHPSTHAPHIAKIYGAALGCLGLIQLRFARRLLSRPALASRGHLSFPLYLVHWPILFGPSAAIFLIVNDQAGVGVARIASVISGLIMAGLAASAFAPIDSLAIKLSRNVRSLGKVLRVNSEDGSYSHVAN